MKKLVMLVFLLAFLCLPLTVNARPRYLNDDPNFPLTGGHFDYFEYTDLSSCTVTEENEQYYAISVGYAVQCKKLGNPYRIRSFRYWKDGETRPQYYNEDKNEWITIPVLTPELVKEFRSNPKNQSIAAYNARFHPKEFFMLRAALRQLWGISLDYE